MTPSQPANSRSPSRCGGPGPASEEADDASNAPRKSGMRKSRASTWRVVVLATVHVLIAIHIAHWFIAGRTLSPVEPSESMFFLERGELNAGFILFSAAILSTFLFGRFFCGWGCHVVALQDLCAWFMKKLGIRPRLFRSRLLVYIPLILALYMFVWPSFRRWVLYPLAQSYWPELYASWVPMGPFPPITNHLLTDDFWATFASVWVAIPFFAVCGFATVCFLGAKGFCTYGCPYGGFFYPADRLAVGKILANLDVCEKCGHCTASCTSNVQIHKEIQVHGQVVDPGCMKCLDCVSVCPTGALSYGLGVPSLFSRAKSAAAKKKLRRNYDLTWPEELAIAGVVATVFFASRGLYALVPMLFAIGIATCAGFLGWKLWRLLRDPEVRLHRFVLKRAHRMQAAGRVFLGLGGLATGLVAHSAVINWNLRAGESRASTVARFVDYEALLGGLPPEFYSKKYRELAADAFDHYRFALPLWRGGWGLLMTPGLDLSLARMAFVNGEWAKSEIHLRKALAHEPTDETVFQLARVLVLQGRTPDAESTLIEALTTNPDSTVSRRELSKLYLATERADRAVRLYEQHLGRVPHDTLARCRLALEIQAPAGLLDAALGTLEQAVALGPENDERAETLDNSVSSLARQLGGQGRIADARRLVETARKARPDSPGLLREAALLALHAGEHQRAKTLYDDRLSGEAPERVVVDSVTNVLIPLGELDSAQSRLETALAARATEERGHRPIAELDHAVAALAGAIAQTGDRARARALLKDSLTRRADLFATRSALASHYLADKEPQAAERVVQERVTNAPRDALAHAQLANLYLQLGRIDDAKTAFEVACRVDPHNGLIRADLALVYFRKQDLPAAIAETRAALELAPHHAMIIGRLSELLELNGETEEASLWRQRLELLQRMGIAS